MTVQGIRRLVGVRAEGENEVTTTIKASRNRWTRAEDETFRNLVEMNFRPDIIAAKLDRSIDAIKKRAYVIGLPLKWFKQESDAAASG